MKSLKKYIKEEGEGVGIAPSIGSMEAASTFSTPGNTIGVGDPKAPTPEEPGSGDLLGKTQKENPKPKKEKKNTSKTKKEEDK